MFHWVFNFHLSVQAFFRSTLIVTLATFFSFDIANAGFVRGPLAQTRWKSANISVCWQAPDPWDIEFYSRANLKEDIEQNTRSQLARAGINLYGWQACEEAKGSDIHLRLTSNPRDSSIARAMGRSLKGIENGIVIKIDNFAPDFFPKRIGLHEILHGLVLLHEHQRTDAPTQGEFINTQIDLGIMLGDYDPESVTNYDLKANRNRGDDFSLSKSLAIDSLSSVLSERDVETLKTLFFEPIVEFRTDFPFLNSSSQIKFDLFGEEINSVKYAWGKREDIDCNNINIYSDQQSVDKSIEIKVPEVEQITYYKFCALGFSSKGNQQNIKSYSSLVWQQIPAQLPSVTINGEYFSKNSPIIVKPLKHTLTKDSGYKIGISGLMSCSDPSKYRPLKKAIKTRLGKWLKDFSLLESESLILCLTNNRSHPNESNTYSITLYGFKHFGEIIRPLGIPLLINSNHGMNIYFETFFGHLTRYKFKLADFARECTRKNGYSSPISIFDPVKISISSDTAEMGLCYQVEDKWKDWSEPRFMPFEANP